MKGRSMSSVNSLVEQLIRDEGISLHLYRDTIGKITIGCGRNLSDCGITQAEATYLLVNDIQNATDHLAIALPWTGGLDDVRHAALLNLTFNMGIGALCAFKKFLAALQAEDWETARNELLDSQYAKQVGARAQRLAIQFETGIWQ
jgi:lysozyme